MIGIYGKVYILFNEVNQRSIQQRCQFWSVLFIAMKKFSSSLVLLCIAVSFLLLVCSHDGEAAFPLHEGSINAPKRREMRKSEVTEQFHFVSKWFRLFFTQQLIKDMALLFNSYILNGHRPAFECELHSSTPTDCLRSCLKSIWLLFFQ